MVLEDKDYIPVVLDGRREYIVRKDALNSLGIGQQAHECREQAQAAQIELLTHRLVEARMVIEQQAKYIIDQERRLREQGEDHGKILDE